MTMLALYPSKKDLKAAVGQPLKFRETSAFGAEYRADGRLTVAGRPHLSPVCKREFFAEVVMEGGKIKSVT
jgi:hypothetical protein